MGHAPRPASVRGAAAAAAVLMVWSTPTALVRRVVPSTDLEATAPAPPPPPPPAPIFRAAPVPPELLQQFARKNFKEDAQTGNYLSPRVTARTRHDQMVPLLIDGHYVKDLRGQTVFLHASIRDKLLVADAAMFEKKKKHLVVNYGFRSNALQQELYKKINGSGKVAEVGGSFHEAGMALDLANWRDAQHFMIDAGFVGGCYGIEEDLVHYSMEEITKASNMDAFKRCTLKEIPENILKGVKAVGTGTGKGVKAVIGKVKGH